MTKDYEALREAVARAIFVAATGMNWNDQADAALSTVREVLREPTPDMVRAFHEAETEDAAVGVPADTVWQNNERLCRATWPAMLAASALGGGDE